MPKDDLKLKVADLEALLRDRDDTIKQLRREITEASDLVDREREHVEDAHALIERWIEVWGMKLDDNGQWGWDPDAAWLEQVAPWADHYFKLVRDWNKFVGDYNAIVRPRNMGRPLQASEAQVQEVRKLRKKGMSLREIAKAKVLSLQTVRTILSQGTTMERTRTGALRRAEVNHAVADFKAKVRGRADLEKRINTTLKSGAALVKEAKGLGKK
jgi:hypothetical protein